MRGVSCLRFNSQLTGKDARMILWRDCDCDTACMVLWETSHLMQGLSLGEAGKLSLSALYGCDPWCCGAIELLDILA